jgi:phosphoenolpyruvate phosphomutase
MQSKIFASDVEDYCSAKSYYTTPDARLKKLRALLGTNQLVRVLEAHNGITGLIVENAKIDIDGKTREYDGIWISSLTNSIAKGKPDIELVDFTSRLGIVNDIVEVTTKHIIYDGDTGGKREHFVFMVRTLERLGVSAIIIEDKNGLKKNSLFGTDVKQTQEDSETFAEKISAGKKAQMTKEFMIIARIESLILKKGLKDAIKRARAYIDAGADAIMVHSKDDNPAEIIAFCNEYNKLKKKVPLVAAPSTYCHISEKKLAEYGINIVIYANHLLRSAYPAMLDTAKSILINGRALEAEQNCMPVKNLLTLIPGAQ